MELVLSGYSSGLEEKGLDEGGKAQFEYVVNVGLAIKGRLFCRGDI